VAGDAHSVHNQVREVASHPLLLTMERELHLPVGIPQSEKEELEVVVVVVVVLMVVVVVVVVVVLVVVVVAAAVVVVDVSLILLPMCWPQLAIPGMVMIGEWWAAESMVIMAGRSAAKYSL